jgi:flavin reductase (DIM6/NTAB) family NADH-FMN oxidoreductase RutF
MTTKNESKIASAICRNDISIVKIASEDHEKISRVLTDLQYLFIQKCKSTGISIKRGRSHNLPTIPDAVHFLIAHANFELCDLENYTELLAREASK